MKVLMQAVVLALCGQSGAFAVGLSTTTIPDSSGYKLQTGSNTVGNAATWKVGGHITYLKTPRPSPPFPAGFFDYAWPQHDSNLCSQSMCDSGLYSAMARIQAVSGAGAGILDPDILVWFDQRLFCDGVQEAANWGDGFVVNLRFFQDGDDWELGWNPGFGKTTNKTFQYKVGAWQGAVIPWQAAAATPGF